MCTGAEGIASGLAGFGGYVVMRSALDRDHFTQCGEISINMNSILVFLIFSVVRASSLEKNDKCFDRHRY